MRATKSLIITPPDHSGRQVRDAVRRALQAVDIEPMQIEDPAESGALLANAVTDAIRVSDLIIADITRTNPNILYELGYAHALRKPTILMVSSENDSKLPSDLAGFQYVTYNPNDLTSLATSDSMDCSLVRRTGQPITMKTSVDY